jgi:enoyl-CoA hydratase/carnithine racemase
VGDPEQWPNPQAEAFFSAEYTLDYRIHTYAKPILLWGSGIVMGGGLGLMAGASHRVATASTRIAMPEISIGLYPDVAGSWFLQRMPARAGLFLGLTGAPLNARDALLCNLADHILPQDGWPQLLAILTASGWHADSAANHGQLTALLGELEAGNGDALADSNVMRCLPLIHQLMNAACCGGPALRHRLRGHVPGAAARRALLAARAAPPYPRSSSAKHLSLAEALRMELVLSLNFCAAPAFREGVRALLVDKDRNPQWSHPTMAAVDQHWVAQHFRSPWREQDHPLATLH